VITTPAVRAVAQLQRRRLSRSLDCAYVRPLAVDGRPAYAAFVDNTALRDRCIEMRKRLLKHPARMGVEYETVLEVDKEYAEALRETGIPTTPAQRAVAKLGKRSECGDTVAAGGVIVNSREVTDDRYSRPIRDRGDRGHLAGADTWVGRAKLARRASTLERPPGRTRPGCARVD
jgi:hypothetical protein